MCLHVRVLAPRANVKDAGPADRVQARMSATSALHPQSPPWWRGVATDSPAGWPQSGQPGAHASVSRRIRTTTEYHVMSHLLNVTSLTTCDHQSKRPEIRETGTPLGVSNKVGDLSPLVYIRKRACGAFFGMHAFGAAFWLRYRDYYRGPLCSSRSHQAGLLSVRCGTRGPCCGDKPSHTAKILC